MPPTHPTSSLSSSAHRLSALRRTKQGFTLVELLVVVAIIGILMTMGIRALATTGGKDIDNSLIEVGGALEAARQLAISQNTYTYLAFNTPSNIQDKNTPLCVAVFQSTTGEDIVKNALLNNQPIMDETSASTEGQWSLVRRPVWLRNTVIEQTLNPDGGIFTANELDGGSFSSTVNPLNGGLAFRLTRKIADMTGASTLTFNRVITFTPNGSAYVNNSLGLPESTIGFMMRPSRTATPSEVEKNNSAAVTVSGLLGNTQVRKKGVGVN